MDQTKKYGISILILFSLLCCYAVNSIAQERPTENTGEGFFTVGSHIFDFNGNEFIPRGVNADHWGGSEQWADLRKTAIRNIKKSGANAVRIVFGHNYGSGCVNTTPKERIEVLKRYVENHLVPIYEYHFDGDTKEPWQLDEAVDERIKDIKWLEENDPAWLKEFEKYVIINIINEKLFDSYEEWYQAYAAAIVRLRDAGIKNLLMIDSTNYGNTPQPLLEKGKDLIQADPEHNIVFSLHTYGGWRNPGDPQIGDPKDPWSYFNTPERLDKLREAGIPVVFGEFNNTAYAEGKITDDEFLGFLEDKGIGWLAWIWYCNPRQDIVASIRGHRLYYTEFGKILDKWLKTAKEPEIFPGGPLNIEPDPPIDKIWEDPGKITVDNGQTNEGWFLIRTEEPCSIIEIETPEHVKIPMMDYCNDHKCFAIGEGFLNKTIRLLAYNPEEDAVAKTVWFKVTNTGNDPIEIDPSEQDSPPPYDDTVEWSDPGKVEIDNGYLSNNWLQIYTEKLCSKVEVETKDGAIIQLTDWSNGVGNCFVTGASLLNQAIRLILYNKRKTDSAKTVWFTLTKPAENPLIIDASDNSTQPPQDQPEPTDPPQDLPIQPPHEVVFFDFGSRSTPTDNDPKHHWNNITEDVGCSVLGDLSNLVDANGHSTAMKLVMLSPFSGTNRNGITNYKIGSADFPFTATRDSFYGNTETFCGKKNVFPKFKLTGLDPQKMYDFTFYASRMLESQEFKDNRETRYTVAGKGSIPRSAKLNVTNNIATYAMVPNIQPNTAGEITISIEPSENNDNFYHFTYLGAMKLEQMYNAPPDQPIEPSGENNENWNPGPVEVFNTDSNWMQIWFKNQKPNVKEVFLEYKNTSSPFIEYSGNQYRGFALENVVPLGQEVRLKFISENGEIAFSNPFIAKKAGYKQNERYEVGTEPVTPPDPEIEPKPDLDIESESESESGPSDMSGTEVCGEIQDQDGDGLVTWNKAQSPYLVTGDILVKHGIRLIIKPGVEVRFMGHHRFTVNGSIDARGTADQRIWFHAQNTDDGWYGLRIWGGGKKSGYGIPDLVDQYLEYCIFEDGNKINEKSTDPSYTNNGVDYLAIRGGVLNIDFEYDVIKDIGKNGRLLHINNNIFRNNKADCGGAMVVQFVLEPWVMENNVFENNYARNQGAAIASTHSGLIVFKNCKFINNEAGGGYFQRDFDLGVGGAVRLFESAFFFRNCVFENNSPDDFAGGYKWDQDGNDYPVAEYRWDQDGIHHDAEGNANAGPDSGGAFLYTKYWCSTCPRFWEPDWSIEQEYN